MKTLLNKLDRMAGRWLENMDEQLQQPIVQAITGEVFTHDSIHDGSYQQDHIVEQITPGDQPPYEPTDIPYPSVLRPAREV